MGISVELSVCLKCRRLMQTVVFPILRISGHKLVDASALAAITPPVTAVLKRAIEARVLEKCML